MRAVVTLVTVAVAIYALVDCLRSRPGEIRWLPKPVWVLAIVLMPLVGSVIYLVLGRVTEQPAPGRGPSGRRVIAPDDDPDFLRSLDTRTEPGRTPRRRPENSPPRVEPASPEPASARDDPRVERPHPDDTTSDSASELERGTKRDETPDGSGDQRA